MNGSAQTKGTLRKVKDIIIKRKINRKLEADFPTTSPIEVLAYAADNRFDELGMHIDLKSKVLLRALEPWGLSIFGRYCHRAELVTMAYETVELSDGQKATLDWLKKEDVPEVVEVLNDVIKEGRYLFLNSQITDMEKELEWFNRGTREGMLYLTARVDGKLVGGASLHPQTDKHRHVASFGIFIGKNHRNLGLGTLLTKEFIEIAKKRELEILQLSVYAHNERAFHVYKKCGFREAGRLTKGIKFLDGTYTDEIIMELPLKRPA